MSQSLDQSPLEQLIGKLPDSPYKGIDTKLPEQGTWPAEPHHVSYDEMTTLIAALGAGRPLLVRGEPGVGKSHFARAAAELLGRHFISYVVQPYTEYQDLLWHVDHTQRLGAAQLLSVSGSQKEVDLKKSLAIENFITPGPLWWAFDWFGSKPDCRTAYVPDSELEKYPASTGVVVLIDEIDKADISLSNGLLEVLGNGAFSVPGWRERVVSNRTNPPLVIITSNDSRQLPAAFLRRCVLLDLKLPEGEALVDHLVKIGRVRFEDMDHQVLIEAAVQIVADRQHGNELARSGQAEYLDFLQTLNSISMDSDTQLSWLKTLKTCFRKTPSAG